MQNSELDNVSNSTNGMPDCWYLDANGKPAPEVFQKHFGLPRRYRNDRKLIEFSMSRKVRLRYFIWALLHYRNLSIPVFLEGDKFASPEAHTLARFDEDWHLRQDDDLIEFAKLDLDDQKLMLADLREVRQEKEWKSQQVKLQSLANRANTTIEVAFETLIKCAVESWLRARNKLGMWAQLDASERLLLAENIFCGFTFFGKRALEDVADIEPQVLTYYAVFLGLRPPADGKNSTTAVGRTKEENLDLSVDALALTNVMPELLHATSGDGISNGEAARDSYLTDTFVGSEYADAPQSLHQLYSLIDTICSQARRNTPVEATGALRIKELLDQHLQRLVELSAQLSSTEVIQLIDEYCCAMLEMTEAMDFAGSEQRDLVPALKAAWKAIVVDSLEDGRPQSWFEISLKERQHLPALLARYDEEQSKIELARAEIEDIKLKLAEAKYTARTAFKASETRKQNEISAAQGELETIRVETAHHLVPDGRTLDDLMEDELLQLEPVLEFDEFDAGAVNSLLAVVETIRSKKFEDSTLSHLASLQVEHSSENISPHLEPDTSSPPQHIDVLVAATAEKKDEVPDRALDKSAVQVPTELATARTPTVGSDSIEAKQLSHIQHADLQAQDINLMAEHDVEIVEQPSLGIDEALRHLQLSDFKDEAQKAFRIAFDQFSMVPSNVIEAIALHWIDLNHLNVAYQILRDAKDSTLVNGRVLDASLLRSAFYGIHLWPRDRDALSYTQRDLNILNHNDLEEQLERKPSGKLVPYLLVCATLQPALFAGSETQAPSLLGLAADYFEGPLKQLIVNVSDYTLRGGRVDLDLLRNDEGQELHFAVTKLRDQVKEWVDLNTNRTTRWHALRIALKTCMKLPIFADAIQAIEDGEKGSASAVRLFVSTYSDHAESRKLLVELVQSIRTDFAGSVDHIDSHAYVSFFHQVDALVAVTQAWLLEVAPTDMRPKDTSEFLKRFHTQLDRSIAALIAHPRYVDLEHRAGNRLLLSALTNLQTEIKGDRQSTWRFEQTDATFRLPEVLARLSLGEVRSEYRLEWFAMHLTSANWLTDMAKLAEGTNAHWVHLLLLRQLEAMGGKQDSIIEAVNTKIAGTRAELKKAIEHFKDLSIQAMSVDVLQEEEHLSNMLLASEWLEKLNEYKPFVDVTPIDEEVKRFTRALDKQLNSLAVALDEELNQGLLNLRTRVGPDAVPEGWETRARTALGNRNLTVVRELVNQLQDHLNRNARLTAYPNQENLELVNFLSVEHDLHTLLHGHLNPREAGERVINERPGKFDYSLHKTVFKDAIETMLEWRSRGPNRKPLLEKKTYDGIVEVLDFVGFSIPDKSADAEMLRNCEYSNKGDFRRLKVRIVRPTLPKGFPLFEDDHSEFVSLHVIFAQGTWNISGLTDLAEKHGLPTRSVLLTGEPLSPVERRAFSNFCRERKCTIFLLDPVVLSYQATTSTNQALKIFLHVTAAWTFYNPYTKGDARQPAPPEMRFGREHDVASLVEPRGAALVYGGRQLGKTTLLHSAVQKFKQLDPTRNRAFYIRMDGLFQHALERDTDVKTRVLERLVSELAEAKILSATTQGKSAEERLQSEFQRDGTMHVLFCLDEIDPVLNKDSRTNFQLVRFLAALVNDPHQRFRVVFAGLNNVNRFRTVPNVPLEQLGSPLQVKILPAADARSLILQPLAALGIRFEDDDLVDRVMAFTNCHPSLLHIFCSELVEQTASDRAAKNGIRIIRQTDLENVESNSNVRRLSGERFDMTLNLDKRYTVAVYGLINHYGKSIGRFTTKQALDVARGLVPEEFEQMSESAFESLLHELVGLGVLRDDKSTHQYAIRNQSILQLIGSPNDIVHKLHVAVRDLANHKEDVLTCHPTDTNLLPSPLSLQDERQILLAKPPEGAPKYSVTVIMGTPALGLSITAIKESFSTISEFQSGKIQSHYETREIIDTQMLEPKRFQDLINTAIDNWVLSRAAVLLVSLEEIHVIDRIMDLLNIANEMASRATRLKHNLRIVFLLGPRSMWRWHSHPWITTSPNEIGGLVELNRWTRHACESLLEQQGLVVTADQAAQLYIATEGWYLPLMKFIEVRKKKGATVSSFNDFASDFTALRELNVKEFAKFVQQTGMTSITWSMPLALQLEQFDSLSEFSIEDLQTAIELLDVAYLDEISPEQAANVVRWWTGLRVVEVNTKEASTNAGKGDKVTYRFTPALQRAIAESVAGNIVMAN